MEKKETFNFYDQTYLKSYNLDQSIKYQLNLLDSLDAFTRKHSENVATLTCNLCKKLHCSKGFTEYCAICAYLHDIGKLFIPASILQKPSQLTNEEYEIIKQHTTLGYKLCIKDTKLRPYHAGPYYHHEALDGTGYPQGLLKNQIPYESQIIRVADEFDAIVNKRQYKDHVGISEALKIIIDNTKPSPDAPTGTLYTKAGKNNKKIVKKLILVVLDDIEYEIACTMDYVYYLNQELERYKKLENYINKKNSAKKQNDIIYYEEYINMLLRPDESVENFSSLYQEFKDAYSLRKSKLEKLREEIKIIKKLKV
jgi:hypothetical protein